MPHRSLGIRAKLILLFVVIKVIPLVLLALLAWQGVSRLGSGVSERAGEMADSVRATVGQLSTVMVGESTRALDVKSRESVERLTTDTALAVADFLQARDRDVLLAAALEPSPETYRQFVVNRTSPLIDAGKWMLAQDGKRWVSGNESIVPAPTVKPTNAENSQDFNYRPP